MWKDTDLLPTSSRLWALVRCRKTLTSCRLYLFALKLDARFLVVFFFFWDNCSSVRKLSFFERVHCWLLFSLFLFLISTCILPSLYNLSRKGVRLRDSKGIASVKALTNSKILRILKAKGLAPEIPEDLYCLIKKAVNIRKHMEKVRLAYIYLGYTWIYEQLCYFSYLFKTRFVYFITHSTLIYIYIYIYIYVYTYRPTRIATPNFVLFLSRAECTVWPVTTKRPACSLPPGATKPPLPLPLSVPKYSVPFSL